MRPANLPTAAADIIAGAAIVGVFSKFNSAFYQSELIVDFSLLILASIFLYAGGVVLNDVFDVNIDAKERPERPIPSGVVSLKTASVLGAVLLLLGVVMSFYCNVYAGGVSLIIAGAILLYDALAKHHSFFGPLVMGSCRGFNLLLGMCAIAMPSPSLLIYMLIPVIYIAAVTLISRGEVHGNNKRNIVFSGVLYSIVIICILLFMSKTSFNLLQTLPFLLLFMVAIFKPLVKAFRINSPDNIKKAVKAGVLSLVIMDATIAVSISNYWWVGLVILLLLPLSLFLSKQFSVT